MKAKEFLRQYQKLNSIIENKLIEREQWKAVAYSITPGGNKSPDKVQAAGNPQKMADAVNRYVDLEKEIDGYIDSLIDRKAEILSVIEQLDTPEYNILHMHYIQDVALFEISSKMGRSYTWVKAKHNRGLDNVEKILEKSEKF